MVQTWDIGSIDPATTSPATDITRLTNGLSALKSQFSGASLPATNLVGGMVALDTTNNVYWRRDPANTKWMLHASAADALVVAKSGAYTAVLGDFEKTLNCSGTWTLGFSAAATLTDGWSMRVINSGSGTITLDPNAAETIDGAASLALAAGDDCIIVCDGAGLRTFRHATLTNSQLQSATHCGTTGGTSTAFTASATPALTANTAKTRIRATLHTAAGLNPTLAVNGLTALPIRYRQYDGTLFTPVAKQAPTNWTSDFEIDNTATYWVMLQTAMPTVSQTIKATRAMDAASGDVSYTLEFQPVVLHIVAVVDGNSGRSEGWAYGTTENCTSKFGGAATVQNAVANTIVYYSPDAAAADIQAAVVKSMDATGCTLTWERTGTTSSAVVTLYITAFP